MFKKDTLAIAYIPRGQREKMALIPWKTSYKNVGKGISSLITIAKKISLERVFSNSLIYDFEEYKPLLREAIMNKEILHKLIYYIFERNLIRKINLNREFGEDLENILDLAKIKCKIIEENIVPLLELNKFLLAYNSGLRGV